MPPDVYDAATRSRVMSRIRGKNTTPEIAVRRLLHCLGFRFRLHRKDLPGCPDIALPRYRVVLFVHGCFWHQHSCKLGKLPKSRRAYWIPKMERNRARDKAVATSLRRLGWTVVVVWECEVGKPAKLERKLLSRLAGWKARSREQKPRTGGRTTPRRRD
jgi:DNA mismatch endonuclease (patch repair protein)